VANVRKRATFRVTAGILNFEFQTGKTRSLRDEKVEQNEKKIRSK
jgi:hypothetical protein